MIERYSRDEMSSIWTDQNRYEAWLEVEILACEAWSELGSVSYTHLTLPTNREV